MKYLHLFKTQSAQTEAYKWIGGKYEEPWVDLVKETDEVHYNLPPIDWKTQYLTFKALENGTFSFSKSGVNYSLDGGETWTELAANTATPRVNAGGIIMFKAELTPSSESASLGIGRFSSTASYEVMGNPYSLLYGDNFSTVTSLTGKNYALNGLFSGSTGLTSAENLSLPATTLANTCYRIMFKGCNLLTTAPALPATTLAASCYQGMFSSCTSLKTAPKLPATTLANYCYEYMFNGCTSLTTAPELPATTLGQYCYETMFSDCTALTAAPELPATTLVKYCYASMFSGCTALATAPSVLPATTLANSCYSCMFSGCTSLTMAPELPAATLDNACYYYMFKGCKSLNYIKMLATNVSAYNCLKDWVSDVASSGTFVKHTNATLPSGTSGIPERWTVQDASA